MSAAAAAAPAAAAASKTLSDLSPDDRAKVDKLRSERLAKAAEFVRDPKSSYKKLCPLCAKPNAEEVDFCTGCSFALDDVDLARVSTNPFLDLVRGVDIGAKVRHRCKDYLVFDDRFGVSTHHLQVIPTAAFDDVAVLDGSHVPMLRRMYALGLEELAGRKDPAFEGRNLEDYVVAGFNYPVSVKWLHLHLVLPPFAHEKVFQYPRWHSYAKVVKDLEEHGAVQLYDKAPNEAEGAQVYDKCIRDHRELAAAAAAAASAAGESA